MFAYQRTLCRWIRSSSGRPRVRTPNPAAPATAPTATRSKLASATHLEAAPQYTEPSSLNAQPDLDFTPSFDSSSTFRQLASRKGPMSQQEAELALRQLERDMRMGSDAEVDAQALAARDIVTATSAERKRGNRPSSPNNTAPAGRGGGSSVVDTVLSALSGHGRALDDSRLREALHQAGDEGRFRAAIKRGEMGGLGDDASSRRPPAENEMRAILSPEPSQIDQPGAYFKQRGVKRYRHIADYDLGSRSDSRVSINALRDEARSGIIRGDDGDEEIVDVVLDVDPLRTSAPSASSDFGASSSARSLPRSSSTPSPILDREVFSADSAADRVVRKRVPPSLQQPLPLRLSTNDRGADGRLGDDMDFGLDGSSDGGGISDGPRRLGLLIFSDDSDAAATAAAAVPVAPVSRRRRDGSVSALQQRPHTLGASSPSSLASSHALSPHTAALVRVEEGMLERQRVMRSRVHAANSRAEEEEKAEEQQRMGVIMPPDGGGRLLGVSPSRLRSAAATAAPLLLPQSDMETAGGDATDAERPIAADAGHGLLARLDSLRGTGIPDDAVPETHRLRPAHFSLESFSSDAAAYGSALNTLRERTVVAAQQREARAALTSNLQLTPSAWESVHSQAVSTANRAEAEAQLLEMDAETVDHITARDLRREAASKRRAAGDIRIEVDAILAQRQAREQLAAEADHASTLLPLPPSTHNNADGGELIVPPRRHRAVAATSAAAASDSLAAAPPSHPDTGVLRLEDVADAVVASRRNGLSSPGGRRRTGSSSSVSGEMQLDPVAMGIAAATEGASPSSATAVATATTSAPAVTPSTVERALLGFPDGSGAQGGGLIIAVPEPGEPPITLPSDAITPEDLKGRSEPDGVWSTQRYVREMAAAEWPSDEEEGEAGGPGALVSAKAKGGAAAEARALLYELGFGPRAISENSKVGTSVVASSSYTGVGTLQERLADERRLAQRGRLSFADAEEQQRVKEAGLQAVEHDPELLAQHVIDAVDAADREDGVASDSDAEGAKSSKVRGSMLPPGYRTWIEVARDLAGNKKRTAKTLAHLEKDRQRVLRSPIKAATPPGGREESRRMVRVSTHLGRVLESVFARRLVPDPELYPANLPLEVASVTVTPDLRTAYVRWCVPFALYAAQGPGAATRRGTIAAVGAKSAAVPRFTDLLESSARSDEMAMRRAPPKGGRAAAAHGESAAEAAATAVAVAERGYDMDDPQGGSARLMMRDVLDTRRDKVAARAVSLTRGKRISNAGRAIEQFGDDDDYDHLSPDGRRIVLRTTTALERNQKELRRIVGRELRMQFVPQLLFHRHVARELQFGT